MTEMRDPSMILVTILCLVVTASTFLFAATFLVRKGMRVAPFYGPMLAMIAPCIAVDVAHFTIDSEESMAVWYLVRIAQMVFSSTLVVVVSIQRLKVFADAGMADWLTDRRMSSTLVSFLVVRVALAAYFTVAYLKMDLQHVWHAKTIERQLLSTLIFGGDAVIDMVCTVITFVLVLRVRVAALNVQSRRKNAASTASTKGRMLRNNSRFLALFAGVVASQMGLVLTVSGGITMVYALPGLKGDAIGALLERVYMFCAMLQWQFIMVLVKNHKRKAQAPASGSSSNPGSGASSNVSAGDKIKPSLTNLTRHLSRLSRRPSAKTAERLRSSSAPPPSPIVPLLRPGGGDTVSHDAASTNRTAAASSVDGAGAETVGG
ncbi:hypothetical protein GGF32_005373 [Allomyces javanicus]|nr:hypothetical protein GGF32_005373 [Allomyces javanicus]